MARRTGYADLPLHGALPGVVARARLGRTDRLEALRRLARFHAA